MPTILDENKENIIPNKRRPTKPTTKLNIKKIRIPKNFTQKNKQKADDKRLGLTDSYIEDLLGSNTSFFTKLNSSRSPIQIPISNPVFDVPSNHSSSSSHSSDSSHPWDSVSSYSSDSSKSLSLPKKPKPKFKPKQGKEDNPTNMNNMNVAELNKRIAEIKPKYSPIGGKTKNRRKHNRKTKNKKYIR